MLLLSATYLHTSGTTIDNLTHLDTDHGDADLPFRAATLQGRSHRTHAPNPAPRAGVRGHFLGVVLHERGCAMTSQSGQCARDGL